MIAPALRSARRKLRAMKRDAERAKNGKPLTPCGTVPPERTPYEEVDDMSAEEEPRAMSFAERVKSEALAEAERVIEDFRAISPRALEVRSVLEALGEEVPPAINGMANLVDHPVRDQVKDGTYPGPATAQQLAGMEAHSPGADAPPEPEPEPEPEPKERRLTGAAAASAGTGAVHRDRILAYVSEHGPDVPTPKIFKALKIGQPQTAAILRTLEEEGLVRHSVGKRNMKSWTLVESGDDASPEVSGEPELPETTVPAPSVSPDLLARVRDLVQRREEAFTPRQLADEADLVPEDVHRALVILAERGTVQDESVGPDLPLFRWERPTDPGSAARLEAERRNGAGDPAAVSEEVAGTGGDVRVADKATQQFLDRCRRAGAQIARLGSGHIEVKNPETGQRLVTGSTPGSSSHSKDVKRARLIGIAI
jgi:ribosomal protein S25